MFKDWNGRRLPWGHGSHSEVKRCFRENGIASRDYVLNVKNGVVVFNFESSRKWVGRSY